jgi:hypothetical protein
VISPAVPPFLPNLIDALSSLMYLGERSYPSIQRLCLVLRPLTRSPGHPPLHLDQLEVHIVQHLLLPHYLFL